MPSLNQTQLIGRLGRDVELRYMPDGAACAALNVATTDKWKDKQTGENREATEWHRCVIYGKLAEIAGEYLKKGSLVYVQGKSRTRQYTDKNDVVRYIGEVKVDAMQMLDPGPGAGQSQAPGQRRAAPTAPQTGGFPDLDDDHIPFAPHAAGRAWSSV